MKNNSCTKMAVNYHELGHLILLQKDQAYLPPVDLYLIFAKSISKNWSFMKSIFGLFRTWILQAAQAIKIKHAVCTK